MSDEGATEVSTCGGGAVEVENTTSHQPTLLQLPQLPPVRTEVGQFVDGVVSEITGPDSFFVQPLLYGDCADKLSQSLNSFYSVLGDDELKITPHFLNAIGSLCVARWKEDERWYRARYLKRESPATIRVSFIDYGNEAVASIRETKQIINYYRNILPPLLLKCRDDITGQIRAKNNVDKYIKKVEGRSCVFKIENVAEDGTLICTVYRVKQNDEEVNISQLMAGLTVG